METGSRSSTSSLTSGGSPTTSSAVTPDSGTGRIFLKDNPSGNFFESVGKTEAVLDGSATGGNSRAALPGCVLPKSWSMNLILGSLRHEDNLVGGGFEGLEGSENNECTGEGREGT